jgi:hypothetical protein
MNIYLLVSSVLKFKKGSNTWKPIVYRVYKKVLSSLLHLLTSLSLGILELVYF